MNLHSSSAVNPVKISHINIIYLCCRGTFGVVKRVVHRRTCEVFAAKFLPLRTSTRTRAFQERDLLSRLAHPRVACLLDFFCTRRTLVLITEMYPLGQMLKLDDDIFFYHQSVCRVSLVYSSLTCFLGAVHMDFWTTCFLKDPSRRERFNLNFITYQIF